MPNGTFTALGLNETFRCMSYFPVIIKTAHFKGMRDHIGKYHGMSFDEAFLSTIMHHRYSQFGIMCTYLFEFHRDEYVWYAHTEDPGWDGINPPPLPGQNGDVSVYTPQMYIPKPRIATHARYRGHHEPNFFKFPTNLVLLYQRGICLSPPFPRNEEECRNPATQTPIYYGYYEEMHRYEFSEVVSFIKACRVHA